MRLTVILALACLLLCSCEREEKQTSTPNQEQAVVSSQTLVENFPLLPLIEKFSWGELLENEAIVADPQVSGETREQAEKQIDKITARLLKRHPFSAGAELISLGGISYHRASRQIKIPAVVSYPKADDTRHPGELELILCSATGRTHETLFTTQTRPLHLEVLMHLAGFKKSSKASLFRLDVIMPDQPVIPVEELVQPTGSDKLPSEILWEFSGSDFSDIYSPDMTGDFLILWHAHDSVLRIRQEKVASGEMNLLPNKHRLLKQGVAVILVLSPVES